MGRGAALAEATEAEVAIWLGDWHGRGIGMAGGLALESAGQMPVVDLG